MINYKKLNMDGSNSEEHTEDIWYSQNEAWSINDIKWSCLSMR